MNANRSDDAVTSRRAVEPLQGAVDGDDPEAALGETLEELSVTIEELEQQNEELGATRELLAAAETAYRQLFDKAPDPYVVTDGEGVIREANGAAATLLGVRRDLLSGRLLATFVDEAAREGFRRRLLSLGRGVAARHWELVLHPRKRKPVIVSASVDGARDPASGARSLLWILRDVTAARRAQESLQQAFSRTSERYEHLREIDRWKDAFLVAAAHDLRSPLAAIRVEVEELARRLGDQGAAIESTDFIIQQVDHLGRLLSDLLDLDQFTRGVVTPNRMPVDVRAMVEDVVDNLHLDRHPVTIAGSPVVAELDVARVRQIVENLVLNAATHTAPGTPVRVEVTGHDDGVTLVVEDEGSGVPAAVREDLLLPFVSAPAHGEDRGGTGIGLSLVELFAQLHGGQVHVRDRDGGGARFEVELPGPVSS